jgi:hypothetical protein
VTEAVVRDERVLNLAEVIRRNRLMVAEMRDRGVDDPTLRGWQAFAGWLQAGCPLGDAAAREHVADTAGEPADG